MRRTTVRRVALFCAVIAVCHALVFACSLLAYPTETVLEARDAGDGLFDSEFRMAVYGPLFLDFSSKKNMFVLGSSSAQDGFSCDELAFLFPGYEVHNLSLRNCNVSDVKFLVEYLSDLVPEEDREATVFIVGLNFPVFFSRGRSVLDHVDQDANGEERPLLGDAITRAALFSQDQHGVHMYFGATGLRVVVNALRPVLLVQKLMARARRAYTPYEARLLQSLVGASGCQLTPPETVDINRVDTEEGREGALVFWKLYADGNDRLPEKQVREVYAICEMARERGVQLVVADLPLPRWFRERSDIYPMYRQAVDKVRVDLEAMPHVDFVDLCDVETEFVDSIHPSRSSGIAWTKALKDRATPP